MLDLFKRLHANRKAAGDMLSSTAGLMKKEKEEIKENDNKSAPITQLARLFIFNSLHDVIASAKIVGYCYAGNNSLYKDESENVYLLLVKGSSNFPKDFNRVCNILSEYGSPRKCQPASLSYLAEHYTCIIPSAALQKLAGIK